MHGVVRRIWPLDTLSKKKVANTSQISVVTHSGCGWIFATLYNIHVLLKDTFHLIFVWLNHMTFCMYLLKCCCRCSWCEFHSYDRSMAGSEILYTYCYWGSGQSPSSCRHKKWTWWNISPVAWPWWWVICRFDDSATWNKQQTNCIQQNIANILGHIICVG